MKISIKEFSFKKFYQKALSLISDTFKAMTPKTKIVGLAAIVLVLVMIFALSTCSRNESPIDETIAATTPAEDQVENIEPTIDTSTLETQPTAVPATMGTITASKLNIREKAGSDEDVVGAYYKGDRVEIIETSTIEDTTWGRTGKGWISMGYVRMDGTVSTDEEGNVSAPAGLISNGDTTVLGYGVVNLGELNVRLGPSTEYDKIGTVTLGTRYAYYQVSSADNSWVRIEDGWVSTEYFYIEGTTTENAFSGTVNTDELNIRTGPDTSFNSTGKFKQGEVISILAQVDRWGYTEKGWVFLSYVEPVAPTYSTGEVTVTRGLNIRQEPNADSEIVGTLVEGNIVTVLEVDGGWGRVVNGWINLKYVKYE